MRTAETSGRSTRQSVIPQPLSRATGSPSGSNEESATTYSSSTGDPSGSVTSPVSGSIAIGVSGSPPAVGLSV